MENNVDIQRTPIEGGEEGGISKVLMVVAVIAVVFSLVGIITTFNAVGDVKRWVGFASVEIGNATLEVVGIANIAFTNPSIDWGDGIVDLDNGFDWANLTSNANITGTQTDGACDFNCNVGDLGSFNNVTRGLVLENQGSTNLSLNFTSDSDADGFLKVGSSGISSIFQWIFDEDNINDGSSFNDGESGSCQGTANWPGQAGGDGTRGNAIDITTTTIVGCANFSHFSASNEVEIDMLINLYKDAPVGTKKAIITATATVLVDN